ncbi:MAG: hypothetical protein NVS4B3_12740 [Gemmatimonadaceae bacterium]
MDNSDARSAADVALLARAQPWAALSIAAFLLHWVWEMLQAPLYDSMRSLSLWESTRLCTEAAAGDVAISLVAYAVVGALVGSRGWLFEPRPRRVTGYLVVGLVATVLLEILSIQRWGRWSYAPIMPSVRGVGLAPLVQWVVVPLVTLWVARRYLAWGAVRTALRDTRSNDT